MASPTFGMPSAGNNAPPPTFGSMTNPTGGRTNMFGGGGSFPSYPIFGSIQATTPMSSVSPFGGASMDSLFNNPLANYYSNTGFWNDVGKAYGKGTGQALQTEFGQLFNGNTVNAYLAAMQPGIAQGQSNILSSFGAEGSRFGSAAAYGLGQYNSQVQLNEGQLIAQMYENAVNQELGVTESMMPTLHAEQANKGGWVHDLVGGLEIAGGIAADVFTAGAATPLTMGLIGSGIGQISSTNSGGGGGGIGNPASIYQPQQFSPYMMPGYGGNTGTFGGNAPIFGSIGGVPNSLAMSPYWNMGNQADIMSVGGGSALGGADPFTGLMP